MKRILKLSYALIIILVIPISLVSGQDKKSEQKIKIVVNDGSGKKTVVDTTFTNDQVPDSLKLKDGSTVFIRHHEEGSDSRHHGGRDHIFVTYSSNGKDEGKNVREITVISSDSVQTDQLGDSDNVRTYSKSISREERGDRRYRVISDDAKGHGDKEEYIYINKGRDKGNDMNTFMTVSDNDRDSTVNKTKYVIAKDGMVVTVEGNDEEKTKQLVKEIKEKLGVNDEGKVKKETVKIESKKTIKK